MCSERNFPKGLSAHRAWSVRASVARWHPLEASVQTHCCGNHLLPLLSHHQPRVSTGQDPHWHSSFLHSSAAQLRGSEERCCTHSGLWAAACSCTVLKLIQVEGLQSTARCEDVQQDCQGELGLGHSESASPQDRGPDPAELRVGMRCPRVRHQQLLLVHQAVTPRSTKLQGRTHEGQGSAGTPGLQTTTSASAPRQS